MNYGRRASWDGCKQKHYIATRLSVIAYKLRSQVMRVTCAVAQKCAALMNGDHMTARTNLGMQLTRVTKVD